MRSAVLGSRMKPAGLAAGEEAAPVAIWRPFVAASLAAALSGGFLFGSVLFGLRAVGIEAGGWWAAAGQAHGHVQVFGWAGLMVLGVAFHFLPRLRGAPLLWPGAAKLVFAALVGGL